MKKRWLRIALLVLVLVLMLGTAVFAEGALKMGDGEVYYIGFSACSWGGEWTGYTSPHYRWARKNGLPDFSVDYPEVDTGISEKIIMSGSTGTLNIYSGEGWIVCGQGAYDGGILNLEEGTTVDVHDGLFTIGSNKGTVTVRSGYITKLKEPSGAVYVEEGAAAYVYGDGTITENNGTVFVVEGTVTIEGGTGKVVALGGTVVIEGDSLKLTEWYSGAAVQVDGSLVVDIDAAISENNGTLEIADGRVCVNNNNGQIDLTGGELVLSSNNGCVDVRSGTTANIDSGVGTLNVYGGDVTTTGGLQTVTTYNGGTLKVHGGTLYVSDDTTIVENEGIVCIRGGAISIGRNDNLVILMNGSVTIDSGDGSVVDWTDRYVPENGGTVLTCDDFKPDRSETAAGMEWVECVS